MNSLRRQTQEILNKGRNQQQYQHVSLPNHQTQNYNNPTFTPITQYQQQFQTYTTTTGQQHQLSASKLNYSRLYDHNTYINTDRLYDPLRETLSHPERIPSKPSQLPDITRHSYVSQNFKVLSPSQAQYMKNNIYIPKDVQLSQTDHFYKIKDKQFVAVNTEQKVIGKAITALELQRLKQEGVKRSMVIYDLKERVEEVEPITTYTPRMVQQQPKQKAKQYKYNLYSMIDQPVNWVREFGCKGANWCTDNEIIAHKNQPQSLKWIN